MTAVHPPKPVPAGAATPNPTAILRGKWWTPRHGRARATLIRKGVTVTDWARAHDVGANLVFEVLSGRRACRNGQSHRIAVLLGIKPGGELVSNPADVTAQLQRDARKADQ